MEDITMDKIMGFFGNIWDFVMQILVDAGVTAVADWKNPFDAFLDDAE